MNGFVSVSMAVLLTARGVPASREAAMAALILTASWISFVVTPIVDCGIPRRAWAMVLAAFAAVGLGTAVLLIGPAAEHGGHSAGATALMWLLFAGYLASQMYSSTIGGMVPNLIDERQQSAASAWLNVAYLGLTGVCGAFAAWEVEHLHKFAALAVPVPILLSASPLLFLGKEERSPRPVREAMRKLFADLWATAKQRSYLFALIVFIVPSATFALQNLFGDLGHDFGASDTLTAWSSGVGLAIACSIGAFLGAPLANRFDRRLLFIAPAMAAAVGSLAMVYAPHREWIFVAGVFFYNLMAGINYTATSALVFQIVGRDNPLSSTQYAVCIAACNAAIAGAVALDGRGAGHGGAAGALTVDALLSLVLGGVVLALVWRFGGGFPRPIPESASDGLAEAAAGAKAV